VLFTTLDHQDHILFVLMYHTMKACKGRGDEAPQKVWTQRQIQEYLHLSGIDLRSSSP